MPEQIEYAVSRALEKRPADRLASAPDFAAALVASASPSLVPVSRSGVIGTLGLNTVAISADGGRTHACGRSTASAGGDRCRPAAEPVAVVLNRLDELKRKVPR